MKLFRITNGLGIWYVVDEDPTAAELKLETELNNADYGFYIHRKAKVIEVVADDNSRISTDHTLLI